MQICRTLQSNKKHTRNDLNIHIDVSLDKVWLIHVCMFLYFFWPQGMWDPSSPTRDQTHAPCSKSIES